MTLRNCVRAVAVAAAVVLAWTVIAPASLRADGPADNRKNEVRRLPKLGVEVPAEKRAELEAGLKKLGASVAALQAKTDPQTRELWPDVAIYHKAVDVALKYQEFHQPKEIDDAVKQLAIGQQRADDLLAGRAPWTTATGLVVRGYISRLDGSVQPYGLIVPASYSGASPVRLDLWFHGRGEVLTELNFVRDRAASVGTFAPADTIVLHPYGRWNNAFKLAGEVDVLEAMASVQKRYRVDEDRIAVRGFSMGGAGAWHMAVHYPDRWFAANPGAGFSETPEFLRVFQKEELTPEWWEPKLWHLYDCPDWSVNLRHCPTVAYSGDEDSQKQAADIMEAALKREKIDLVHVIGPMTKHSYHPAARDEVERRLASLAKVGRERVPQRVQFVTYTLKYNRTNWVQIDGLNQHWEQARIDASFQVADSSITATTKNISALTLDFPPGYCPLDLTREVKVTIDGATLVAPRPGSDRSFKVSLVRDGDAWKIGARDAAELRKRHELQGPIDDAFMDSFLFVHPTGKAFHEPPAVWSDAEMTRAAEHWRRHFRGDVRVKEDQALTDDDLAKHNLVLWGDPSSNKTLAKIIDRLPIQWDRQAITVGSKKFPSDRHALIAIYPNPLNPKRYVVLNSGFTFRDYAHLNNARQVPVLPDWAVIDLTTPAGFVWPGKVAEAGFFDEQWKLK